MASERLSAHSEYSEEERAFLQTRVALFWKSLFIIALIASGLGAIGTIIQPGLDSLLNFASAVQAGVFWWLCQRGVRSIRFLRAMEGGGLLLSSMISAPHGYYLSAAFIREHALVGSQAAMLAEAYLTLMQVAGLALILPIRAALIPSRPRHTVAMSVLFGVPPILLNSLFVPSADGALVARPLD